VKTIPGRLEVRTTVPANPSWVTVEARITFTVMQQTFVVEPGAVRPVERSGAEYELYTNPNEGLVRVTPTIRKLAGSLAGSSENPWTAMIAIQGFFFDHLKYGCMHLDELDRADPLGSLLERGWFNCITGSALFVALCRAKGIPARLVSGLMLWPTLPGNHYWIEVLVPPYGWVPADLAAWDLAAGQGNRNPWSRWYLGHVDYRMKCQCFPRLFEGMPGVHFPASWYSLSTITQEGTQTAYYALEGRRLLYRERLQFRLEEPTD
jgi:transglutaminase-like putative cysteine protease